jgi:uncharacterized spore protein YtfJ
MKTTRSFLLVSFLLCGLGRAQGPLAKPLADFDKLVSLLKSSSLVSEPIRAGDTAVVPFAKLHFSVGAGEIMAGFGGGMGVHTVPVGVLIVEGDDVRVELFPEEAEKPSALSQLFQAILDRKVTIMANGINLGNASGNVKDLAPLVSELMGHTNVMVQAVNLGNLNEPKSEAFSPKASVEQLQKLIDAKKYPEALAMAESILAKDPKNADVFALRTRILGSQGGTK